MQAGFDITWQGFIRQVQSGNFSLIELSGLHHCHLFFECADKAKTWLSSAEPLFVTLHSDLDTQTPSAAAPAAPQAPPAPQALVQPDDSLVCRHASTDVIIPGCNAR